MILLASKSRSYFRHGCDYSIDLRIAHGGKEWQRESTPVFRFGAGKISRLVAKLVLIKRVQVKRNKMDAGANAALFQLRDKLVTVDGKLLQPQTQNIKMPGALTVGIIMRRFQA